jgi:hypothetical protein
MTPPADELALCTHSPVEQESLMATEQHAGGCKQIYKECRSAVTDL